MNTASGFLFYAYVTYASFSIWGIIKGMYEQKILLVLSILLFIPIIASQISINLTNDLYHHSYKGGFFFEDKNDPFYNEFSTIRWLFAIVLTSLLRILVRPRIKSNKSSDEIHTNEDSKSKNSLVSILNSPIVNIISLISSILGIISFYLDYFAKK